MLLLTRGTTLRTEGFPTEWVVPLAEPRKGNLLAETPGERDV